MQKLAIFMPICSFLKLFEQPPFNRPPTPDPATEVIEDRIHHRYDEKCQNPPIIEGQYPTQAFLKYEIPLRVHPAHGSFQLGLGDVEVAQGSVVVGSGLG